MPKKNILKQKQSKKGRNCKKGDKKVERGIWPVKSIDQYCRRSQLPDVITSFQLIVSIRGTPTHLRGIHILKPHPPPLHWCKKTRNLETWEHHTAARDLLAALRCFSGRCEISLAAVWCSQVPTFPGFLQLCPLVRGDGLGQNSTLPPDNLSCFGGLLLIQSSPVW